MMGSKTLLASSSDKISLDWLNVDTAISSNVGDTYVPTSKAVYNTMPSYTTNSGASVSTSAGTVTLTSNYLVVTPMQNGTKYELNLYITFVCSAYSVITISLPSSMQSFNAGHIQVSSNGDWKNWERQNAVTASLASTKAYLYICDDTGTKYFYVHIETIK